jgi:acyl carrier protein
MEEARVISVILGAVREYNQQVPVDRRISETPETTLFGAKGKLDSLGLVNLILIVEEHLKDECHVSLTLADERAMSEQRNPFGNVQSLASYILCLLNQSPDA